MPTFYERFQQSARQFPDKIALEIQRQDRTESLTFAQLQGMAESVGSWLTGKVERDSRVAILAANHPRWVAAYLGIICAGRVAVPLDTAFHADQVAKLLKDSGASILFCDAKHLAVAQQAAEGLPVGLVMTSAANEQVAATSKSPGGPQPVADLDSIFAGGSGGFKPVVPAEGDLAALLYTSGTTADPKGVMLTHGNLVGEANAVFQVLSIGPSDALLGILPMFHVLAQMANLFLPLFNGARVVYLETLNTTELLRALQERRITAFCVVPQFFYLIHERIFKEVLKRGRLAQWALRVTMAITRVARRFGWNTGRIFFRPIHKTFGSKMRYLITGGSRFDLHIASAFHALGIDVLQAYGLTETTGAAFVTPPKGIVLGSDGPPLPGVEAKIIDPQSQEDGGLAVGEIAIQGAIVMKGYWNRPDVTAAILKDDWLYTGDLGYLDAHGNLFITGRKKEVIVLSNGKNIYPEEIEAHYLKSPYIKEICVMGLEGRPGDPASDRLHAVLVPNFALLKERKIVNVKEVIRFDIESLSAQLPSTKRIGSYEIWQDDLPRTTTRKLKRFEIERRVRTNQAKGQTTASEIAPERPLSAEDAAWLEQPEVERALKIVRQAAKTAQEVMRPSDNLELDLGLDSMQRVELLVALEEELGGDVEESRLSEIYTVREMVDLVLESARESAAAGKTTASSRPQFAGWKTVLQEEPTDAEVMALARQQPFAAHFTYGLTRLVQIFAYDRFQLRVTGLEKLPKRD